MKNILIDTDIILDFFFDRKPFADSSAKILFLCENKIINGYVTPVIISNVYYLLRKTATHEKVIEKLKIFLTFINILQINKVVIEQAMDSSFKDFEDALQNYAAENHKSVQVVITRNIRDFKNSNLAIMTPDSYLKVLELIN